MVIANRRILSVIFIFAIVVYSPSSKSHAQCPLAYTFTGEAAGDRLGHSVSGAGDVNNDGYADLIVGAVVNDAGGSDAGRAYVFACGSQEPIPTLSEWGMFIMFAVMATGIVWFVVQHRRRIAAA